MDKLIYKGNSRDLDTFARAGAVKGNYNQRALKYFKYLGATAQSYNLAQKQVEESGAGEVFNLFANDEQGAWYDPSDLTTLYQDSAGTTPVTADGDPVGLMLDKRLGSPQIFPNGSFDSNINGWLEENANVQAEWDLGRIKVTNNGVGWAYYVLSGLTVGETYTFFANFVTKNGGGRLYLDESAVGSLSYGAFTAAGPNSITFVATTDTLVVSLGDSSGGTGVVNVYDDFKLIPGNHATQSVAASRPTYRTDGTLHWLEFDGVDDYLFCSTGSTTGGLVVAVSARYTDVSEIRLLLGHDTIQDRKLGCVSATRDFFFRAVATGTAIDVDVPNYVGETKVFSGSRTADDLLEGFLDSTKVGESPAHSGTAGFNLLGAGGSGTGETQFMSGRIYGVCFAESDAPATDRASLEQYVAKKAGVTL